MGLTEILQAMERKTDLEIGGLKSSAEKECRLIIDGAEEEARRIKEKHRAEAAEKLRREQERLFSAAKLDKQRKFALARETWLNQTLATARGQLANLRTTGNYAGGLERLTREALAEIGSAVKVEIDSRDEELMRRIMLTLGIEAEIVPTLRTLGGLRAMSLDGRISVDNTVEVRLEKAWGELRQRLAQVLTSEEVSCPAISVTLMRESEH
jgi:vacuolar-type H+-ATPase subunit E/Vma4